MPSATGQDSQAQSDPPLPSAAVTGKVVYSERKETLHSNLLKVASVPPRLFMASTAHRFAEPVWTALRQAGGEIGPEWLLASKRMLSFRDLREHPWNTVCNPATVQSIDTREWSASDDPDRRRDFVRLLNHCLRAFTRSLDLRYNRDLNCYYFPATPDMRPRTLTYKSLQQKTSRDVFAVYYKKNDPEAIGYCRHSAFGGFFERLGESWYLEITPTYVFTVDGYRLSRFHGELLSGIKRFDRNPAVLGQIVMWADYLTPEGDLFSTPYPYLRFGKLERFEVNREIDDAAWMSQDSTARQEGGEPPEHPADEP